MTPYVAKLFVHPLKGARPVAVDRLPLDAIGAVGDRRWMLVDSLGNAITPREVPRLAQLVAQLPMHNGAILTDEPLTLGADGMSSLTVAPVRDRGSLRSVRCWDDQIDMADAGDVAAQWCSDALGSACRLVHMTDATHRPLAAKYAGPLPHEARTVSVTDGAPLLLLGTGSLDELNTRLQAAGAHTLTTERFRPNVLLTDIAAHEEDGWSRIRIGSVEIGVGSPCPRCVVTTIEPSTLEKSVEPLRTLATYRRGAKGNVMFGMNATHAAPGIVHRGDLVTVLARRQPS